MSALTRAPQNTNLLQPTKFLLSFDRIGTSQFFCQTVNIPGINLGSAPINTPVSDIYAPGNKITYDELSISFIINEDLQTWQDIHSWFRSIASPEGFSERNRLSDMQTQFSKNKQKNYSDATLTVMSALNNPLIRIQFYNAFPTSLSSIEFDTTKSADAIVTASASFRFDYFNFIDA
jgi:hypothetical protein